MRLTNEKWWLFGFLCCLAAGICFWVDSQDGTEDPNGHASVKIHQGSKSSSEQNFPILPLEKKEPISADLKQPASLAQEMQHARNFRVLYLNALQRINEGGGFYALNILMRCSSIRHNPDSVLTASRSPEQAAARVLREERCASFSEDELSPDSISFLSRDARLKKDPLVRLDNEWKPSSQDPARRVHTISAMLQTQDPLLLERIAGALFYTPSGSVHFNGETFSQEYALPIFASAWLGAICEATEGNCGGKDDFLLVDACSMHDACGESRAAALAADVALRFDQNGVALYRQIFPALVKAIKTRDAQAFNLP